VKREPSGGGRGERPKLILTHYEAIHPKIDMEIYKIKGMVDGRE